MTLKRPSPAPTGYQPYLPEVTEEEALALFMHHATCATAYFELTELSNEDMTRIISNRFSTGTVESRALLAFAGALDYIYGD